MDFALITGDLNTISFEPQLLTVLTGVDKESGKVKMVVQVDGINIKLVYNNLNHLYYLNIRAFDHSQRAPHSLP